MRVNITKDGNIVISDFSPVQAYKIAIHLEEDGIVFYKDLLEKVRDSEARREIDFLIKEEENHLKTFQELLNQEKEVEGDAFEEDDIADFLNTQIFDTSQEKKIAQTMGHRHTALEEAMDMERRSIVFYEGCLTHTKDSPAQKAFKTIIEEEKRHLSKFAELLRAKCIQSKKGCLL